MKVLYAVSELAPWITTGGLADVAAALPAALRAQGVDVRLLLPDYPALKAAFPDAAQVASIPAASMQLPGAALRQVESAQGVPIYLLECNVFYDRPGSPYVGPEGHDWLDNGFRFGQLARVAALLASDASPLAWRPDILHCNDWQTGLAPAYVRYGSHGLTHARTVMTVHNLAFQGLYGRDLLQPLALPDAAWQMDGVEYHGYLSYLKTGLQLADALTTVSPTYAREIQTHANGMGMDALLRHRAGHLTGIVNGIDTTLWDPARDKHIVAPYSARSLPKKQDNTRALRRELGLDETFDGPLLGLVGRLTYQKGIDLIPPIAHDLVHAPAQLVILGSGDKALEAQLGSLAHRFPGKVAVKFEFNEGLAHRIEAGADLFLMPSRFEPCGLGQLYSLRYGTLPIVRATGGLADTVRDVSDSPNGNGFVFAEATPEALLGTIRRATAAWADRRDFAAVQRRAMSADYSWQGPAKATREIYQALMTHS